MVLDRQTKDMLLAPFNYSPKTYRDTPCGLQLAQPDE